MEFLKSWLCQQCNLQSAKFKLQFGQILCRKMSFYALLITNLFYGYWLNNCHFVIWIKMRSDIFKIISSSSIAPLSVYRMRSTITDNQTISNERFIVDCISRMFVTYRVVIQGVHFLVWTTYCILLQWVS